MLDQVKIINNYCSAFQQVFPAEWRKIDNVFLKTIGFGALINAFEEVYIQTRDLYRGFRVSDIVKLLKPVVGFDFGAWNQYGTGNKAEQSAGKDLREIISKAITDMDSSREAFPL